MIPVTGQLYSFIYRHYQGFRLRGISQLCVEGVGWYPTLITEKEDFEHLVEKGTDSVGRPIRAMQLRLISEDGMQERLPDFYMSELRKNAFLPV